MFIYFTQAIYRNVCECGLKKPYEENEAVKRIIRLLLAPAYLPENHVCEAISELLQEREVMEATRQFPDLAKIYQYFHRTWIMTSPQSFGMCMTAPNDCASQTFVKAGITRGIVKFNEISPKFWTAVRFLKQQQREIENKIALTRRGFRAPIQQKKWRNFNERVPALKTSLARSSRRLKNYWLNMSHLCSSI